MQRFNLNFKLSLLSLGACLIAIALFPQTGISAELEANESKKISQASAPRPTTESPTQAPSVEATPKPAPVAQPEPKTATELTTAKQIIRIEIAPASVSRIPADGRSTVTLSGQLLNETGAPIQAEVTVTLTSSAGKFIGADQDRDRAGFQVIARQGKFTAELQSSLEAQQVNVRAAVDPEEQEADVSRPPFPDPSSLRELQAATEAYTQVEFITNLRPSLVSGVVNLRVGAAGTNFYGRFRDYLSEASLNDGTRLDFYSAVFATGRVGEWLFTGAFNNSRPLNEHCDGTTRLFRDAQFCDQTYPTDGDSSTVDYLTPSIDSVYAKFERTSPTGGQDFFMWGDYKTEEFARASQYYTATARQLHGFKANYNFGDLQATFLYGDNLDGFQRDAIVPNGTSGFYFLSRRLVLGGSESVFLETEELNRPGTVVERVPLNRITDYEIDYDRGTLLFRRPIQTTEFDLFGRTLVRRIVVTYQYENQGGGSNNLFAGRLQYNLSRAFQRESWAGVTYLREDQGIRDFELYGADLLFNFGKEGQLIAEFARSSHQNSFIDPFAVGFVNRERRQFVEGSAYRVEARSPLFSGVSARGYYRSVEEGFANNATFSFAPGQTRYGAEIGAKLSHSTLFRAQVDREINFGIASVVRTGFDALFDTGVDPLPGTRLDNRLTTISAGVEQKIGNAAVSVDWIHRNREDRATNNLDEDSDQIVSRLRIPITEKLSFRAQNETNFSGQDPLYPNRTTFGLDWSLFDGVTLRLAQQFSSGGQFANRSITSLDTILDRKLSEDTSFTGRYSVLNGVNGVTGQGAIGLNHRIRLSPGLRINLGYERIFGDIFAYTAAGQQYAQPFAVSQSAASLGVGAGDSFSVGVEYTDSPDFKTSARFEHRNSDLGENTVWSIAAAGKISPAITALLRFQQANASNQLLTGLGDTANLKFGLAYRDPNDDKLNLLLRYEYRQNPGVTPDSLRFGNLSNGERVHIAAIEALYAPNFRWEFYGKYALRSTIAPSIFQSSNFISLAQFRTTYRLGYNWDLGGEVRWIGQSITGFNQVGFLVEAGYYLTPNLRAAVGYSFGDINNDRDFEGSRSRGGIYATLSLKLTDLFGGFGLQRVAPPQQQESRKTPVAIVTPTESTTAAEEEK